MSQIEELPWLVLSLIIEHLDPVSSCNFHLTCSSIHHNIPASQRYNKLVDRALNLGFNADQMLRRAIDSNLEKIVIPILRRFRAFIDRTTYNEIVAYAGHQKRWDIGNIICNFDFEEMMDEITYFDEMNRGNTILICEKINDRLDFLFDQYLKGKYVKPRLRFYLQKVLSSHFFPQYRRHWAVYHKNGKDLNEPEIVNRAKEYVKYYMEHPDDFCPFK